MSFNKDMKNKKIWAIKIKKLGRIVTRIGISLKKSMEKGHFSYENIDITGLKSGYYCICSNRKCYINPSQYS